MHIQQWKKADVHVGSGPLWWREHGGEQAHSCQAHGPADSREPEQAKQVWQVRVATALMTRVGEMYQTGEAKCMELKGLWDDVLLKRRRR